MSQPRHRSDLWKLLPAGCLAFLLLGSSQALYGPAFDAFGSRHGIDASAVGFIVSAHFMASFIAMLSSSLVVRRFGYPRSLTGAAVLMAVGAASVAMAVAWAMALAGAFVLGFGFGLMNIALSLLFVRRFGARSAAPLNLLNALFGLGALLGPALVAATVPAVEIPFLAAAALAVAVALLAPSLPQPDPPDLSDVSERPSLLPVLGFVLFYFFYVATELSAAAWETKHLSPHYGLERAALYNSLYWGAMTVGRVLVTPLAARVSPQAMIVSATLLGFLATLLTHRIEVAPLAYMLLGFAFAPIFPTGLAWIGQTFPRRSETVAPLAVAAGNLGPVLGAPVIGLAVAAAGTSSIPIALNTLAGLLVVVTVLLALRTRPSLLG